MCTFNYYSCEKISLQISCEKMLKIDTNSCNIESVDIHTQERCVWYAKI